MLLQTERYSVNGVSGEKWHDRFAIHIAKERSLGDHIIIDGIVTA